MTVVYLVVNYQPEVNYQMAVNFQVNYQLAVSCQVNWSHFTMVVNWQLTASFW